MKALAALLVLAALAWLATPRIRPTPPVAVAATPTMAKPATSTALPAAPAPSAPGRQVTWSAQLGRYVEHDGKVGVRTAAGLNAFAPPLPATPAKGTMLDQPARR